MIYRRIDIIYRPELTPEEVKKYLQMHKKVLKYYSSRQWKGENHAKKKDDNSR